MIESALVLDKYVVLISRSAKPAQHSFIQLAFKIFQPAQLLTHLLLF